MFTCAIPFICFFYSFIFISFFVQSNTCLSVCVQSEYETQCIFELKWERKKNWNSFSPNNAHWWINVDLHETVYYVKNDRIIIHHHQSIINSSYSFCRHTVIVGPHNTSRNLHKRNTIDRVENGIWTKKKKLQRKWNRTHECFSFFCFCMHFISIFLFFFVLKMRKKFLFFLFKWKKSNILIVACISETILFGLDNKMNIRW